MKQITLVVLVATGLFVFATTNATADDAKKSKKQRGDRMLGAARMIEKHLSDIELTETQTSSWKTAKASFSESMAELRDKGLTPELMKKQVEVMKSARAEGMKRDEIAGKLSEVMTTEEQELLQKAREAQVTLKKSVAAMLTPEQMDALPENARKQLTVNQGKRGGKAKSKSKPKKAAAAD